MFKDIFCDPDGFAATRVMDPVYLKAMSPRASPQAITINPILRRVSYRFMLFLASWPLLRVRMTSRNVSLVLADDRNGTGLPRGPYAWRLRILFIRKYT